MLANTLHRPRSWQRATGAGEKLRARAWRVALLALGSSLVLALSAGDALAGQLPVSLGKAGSFAALAGSTVTSTGLTTLNGDLGVSPGSSLTGFPPGRVNGTVHATDPTAAQAQADLTAAYNDAAGRQPPQALPADIGGRTLVPGVYKTGATPALRVTGTLTLDGQGDPNAVFVLQVGSTLSTAVNSHVNLIGGAKPGNVFWQIGSSATLGTSSTFAGSILALTSISIDSGVTLNGRALARNGAVTLIDDTINVPTLTPPPPPPPGGGPTGGGGGPPGGGGGPPGGGPPGGGQTGFCVAGDAPTSPADRHAPAGPLLLFPRARARVSAGIVRFSWRPAARAARYTLMVDHRRMNTGCATRKAMRVSVGSHSYRVVAQNRYGTRSSRRRAFTATTAASKITCTLKIDYPHNSFHNPFRINVVANWKCPSPVHELLMTVKLFTGGLIHVELSKGGPFKNYRKAKLRGNTSFPCLGSGFYFARASGTVIFAQGYVPHKTNLNVQSADRIVLCPSI